MLEHLLTFMETSIFLDLNHLFNDLLEFGTTIAEVLPSLFHSFFLLVDLKGLRSFEQHSAQDSKEHLLNGLDRVLQRHEVSSGSVAKCIVKCYASLSRSVSISGGGAFQPTRCIPCFPSFLRPFSPAGPFYYTRLPLALLLWSSLQSAYMWFGDPLGLRPRSMPPSGKAGPSQSIHALLAW